MTLTRFWSTLTSGAPFSGPMDPTATSWGRRLLLPLVIVCTIAALVALLEVDRLVSSLVAGPPDRADAIDYEGMTASLAQVTGFGALDQRHAWDIWRASEAADHVTGLVVVYVVLDLVFIIGYSILILQLTWHFVPAMFAGFLGAVLDIVEGLALITASGSAGDGAAWVVAWAAVFKWLALVASALLLFASAEARQALVGRLHRVRSACKAHALALIFLVGFAFLALVPSTGIWDQIPDVQRQWVDGGDVAFRPVIIAGLVLVFAGIVFWYLGRQRTEVAHRRFATGGSIDSLPRPSFVWWLSIPYGLLWVAVVASFSAAAHWAAWLAAVLGGLLTAIVAGLVAGAEKAVDAENPIAVIVLVVILLVFFGAPVACLIASGAGASVNFGPLMVMLGIGAFVLVASWFVGLAPGPASPGIPADPQRFHTVWLLGDAIAVLVVSLGPLTVLRSFTAPVVISCVFDGGDIPALERLAQVSIGMLIAAILGLVAVPALGFLLLSHIDSGDLPRLIDPTADTPESSPAAIALDVAMVLMGAAAVGYATLAPTSFADLMGPIGATVLLLTAWGMMLGGVILSFQRRQPLRIFRQFGLRGTPVLSLTAICIAVVTILFADPRLHAVRVLPSASEKQQTENADGEPEPADAEDSVTAIAEEAGTANSADPRFTEALEQRFDEWLALPTEECESTSVRPMILVAAAGGGGRAAYWTVESLKTLREYGGGCLQGAIFAASGISGGSVGLVVDQQEASDDPESAAATNAIKDLVGPAPLSRVVTALLAGDMVAGLTGARISDLSGSWLDRAGHLETAWAEATAKRGSNPSSLDLPFNTAATPGQPFLILNSADAVSGCRVSVVQLDIAASSDPYAWASRLTPDACGRTDLGAGYALAFDEVWPGCSGQLRWSTAALLSARFPYVTPAGWMPVSDSEPCAGDVSAPDQDGKPQAQLVDGGYSDDSGLAAIADLLPELLPLIAEHNAQSAAPILPVVVYLKNDRGFELDATVKQLAAEVLVPLAALDARSLQNREAAWLQRIADSLETIHASGANDPENGSPNTSRVVVMSPDTVPTPIPPLGWTLSEFSRVVLEAAADAQACEETKDDSDILRLGDLVAAFPAKDATKACAPS